MGCFCQNKLANPFEWQGMRAIHFDIFHPESLDNGEELCLEDVVGVKWVRFSFWLCEPRYGEINSEVLEQWKDWFHGVLVPRI